MESIRVVSLERHNLFISVMGTIYTHARTHTLPSPSTPSLYTKIHASVRG